MFSQLLWMLCGIFFENLSKTWSFGLFGHVSKILPSRLRDIVSREEKRLLALCSSWNTRQWQTSSSLKIKISSLLVFTKDLEQILGYLFPWLFCRWWNEEALQENMGCLKCQTKGRFVRKKQSKKKRAKFGLKNYRKNLSYLQGLVQALHEKRVMLQNGFIVKSFLKVRCSNLVLRNGYALKWLTLDIHCIADFFGKANFKIQSFLFFYISTFLRITLHPTFVT